MQNNNIIYGRASLDEELYQILKLQKQNLPDSLSLSEREREGFLTVDHTFEILSKMNDCCPHIIAKHDGKVVGYALCMHPKFANEIEVLKPMFKELNKITSGHSNYMIMGQICIDKAYRGTGIFRGLYDFMKKELQNDLPTIITEVDAKNIRSLNAHLAVGFEITKTYNANNHKWHIIRL